jgi:ubiquinone/menaquinone biosynthesis C-methylase UbiE
MSQKEAFLNGEGDRWHERNSSLSDDPILPIIQRHRLSFSNVLEIGSGDGRRLLQIKAVCPHANFEGVDPSRKAVNSAVTGISLRLAAADDLPYGADSFDLVIFGFCLYLCDRPDLFKIAAEADRVLQDHGTIIVYDFHPPQPYRNPYKHLDGLFSYKMDYSRMFSWNPAYQVIAQDVFPHPGTTSMEPDNRVGITVMRKNIAEGWGINKTKPLNENRTTPNPSVKTFETWTPSEQSAFIARLVENERRDLVEEDPEDVQGYNTLFQEFFAVHEDQGRTSSEGVDKINARLAELNNLARQGKSDLSKVRMRDIVLDVVDDGVSAYLIRKRRDPNENENNPGPTDNCRQC